jgi:hypothetical protein
MIGDISAATSRKVLQNRRVSLRKRYFCQKTIRKMLKTVSDMPDPQVDAISGMARTYVIDDNNAICAELE